MAAERRRSLVVVSDAGCGLSDAGCGLNNASYRLHDADCRFSRCRLPVSYKESPKLNDVDRIGDSTVDFGALMGNAVKHLCRCFKVAWAPGLSFIHKWFQHLARRQAMRWQSQSFFGFLPIWAGALEVVQWRDYCSRRVVPGVP